MDSERIKKLSLYQLLLLFFVYIPPQGMNLTLILIIISNITPVITPIVFHYYNSLLIQVRVSLLKYLLLQHIC